MDSIFQAATMFKIHVKSQGMASQRTNNDDKALVGQDHKSIQFILENFLLYGSP